MPIDKDSITLSECENPRYIGIQELRYVENGTPKRWEVVASHDSVSILIHNRESQTLVLVRQFRPAVFLRNGDGYMYELCAGLVDKSGKSVEEIAKEEALEECGYAVGEMEQIAEFYASVGTSGARQTLFYAEVTNADKVAKGGGVDDECIEIIEIECDKVGYILAKQNITQTLGFALLWFLRLKNA